MDVVTRESVTGYLAQKYDLEDGDRVLKMQLGQKRYRREPDNSFTLIGTAYVPLVMFDAAAEAANERFAVGDDVVAIGNFKPRVFLRDGQRVEVMEFRAKKLLFDTSHGRYQVSRRPRTDSPDRVAATSRVPEVEMPEDDALVAQTGQHGVSR